MKIMFFSFEVYPLAKVGGLADVVNADVGNFGEASNKVRSN